MKILFNSLLIVLHLNLSKQAEKKTLNWSKQKKHIKYEKNKLNNTCFNFMALSCLSWVIKFEFSTSEVNHIDGPYLEH
jgi:hypothetical protein